MIYIVDTVKSENHLQEFQKPKLEHVNDFKGFSTIDKDMKLIICFKKSVWSVYYMGNYRYFQDTFLLYVIFTLWAYFRANLCYLLAYSYYCLLWVCRYNILFIIWFWFLWIWVNMKCHFTWYLISGKFHILGSIQQSSGF